MVKKIFKIVRLTLALLFASAEGIEQKTKEAYKNTLNPFGL